MDVLLATQEILLYPFKLAKSRTAQRAYLSSILLGLGSLCLLGLAVVGYGIFYMNYVPKIGIDKVIYLQYGGPAGEGFLTAPAGAAADYPTGMAFLGDSIHTDQPYDISVSLHLPTSPNNYELGNFMVDMELWTQDPKATYPKGTPITRSSRPAILTYQSPLAYTMKTLFKAPLLLLGWSREAENVNLKIMEDIEFGTQGGRVPTRKGGGQVASGRPGMIKVRISAKRIQIYEVKVSFRAKLSGIRWLMYNHRIISFVIFATSFWIMEMISAFLVWYFILNSLTRAWIPERPRGKKPLLEDDLRGTVSDLDLETDVEEEYSEAEDEYEVEGTPEKRKEGARLTPGHASSRGEHRMPGRELGYPSPEPTPGPETPGAVVAEEIKNTTGYADDEEDEEEASDETGEMVERPPPQRTPPAEAEMATDSGFGSSWSEGTARAGAAGGQSSVSSTGRSDLGGWRSSLQRRRNSGEGE